MTLLKRVVGSAIGSTSWTNLFKAPVAFVLGVGELFNTAELSTGMELHS